MRAKRVLAIGITVALGAALVGGAIVVIQGSGREVVSTTAVRAWGAEAFDLRVAPDPALAWPSLSSGSSSGPPPPPPIVTREVDSLSVLQPVGGLAGNLDWRYFQRVEAGPTGAALPDAPGAAAQLLYWRVGTSPWLSPDDGFPVNPQPTWPFESDSNGAVSFILKTSGSAFRLHGPSLFDRTTKASLSSSSSWTSTGGEEGEMRIDLFTGLGHRSHLLLEVRMTYGTPEVRELALTDGASAMFAAGVEAQFLARGPGRIRSRGSGDTRAGVESRLKWDPTDGSEDFYWAALVFSPRGLAPKFQALVPGTSNWTMLDGGMNIPILRRIPAATEAIELRYLPHAARVQFELPPPSCLPVAEDLLDLELGDVNFESRQDVWSLLSQTLQLEGRSVRQLDLDRLPYPIVLKGATPRDFMDLIREHVNPAAHIEWGTHRLRVKRAPTFARFRVWITGHARRFGF